MLACVDDKPVLWYIMNTNSSSEGIQWKEPLNDKLTAFGSISHNTIFNAVHAEKFTFGLSMISFFNMGSLGKVEING